MVISTRPTSGTTLMQGFRQGVDGRWRGVLTEAQLDRYADMAAALPGEAAEWLEHGSLVLGRRP